MCHFDQVSFCSNVGLVKYHFDQVSFRSSVIRSNVVRSTVVVALKNSILDIYFTFFSVIFAHKMLVHF